MTVNNQDVKMKSFIHKIFTTKEKEGNGYSDFSAPLQALEVFAQIGAQKRQILWNKWSQRSILHYRPFGARYSHTVPAGVPHHDYRPKVHQYNQDQWFEAKRQVLIFVYGVQGCVCDAANRR
ncbi:hypothetical protein C1H46_010243 [Malus baccata]|uniref:Uncharacterized protein n=1 Tax=Malus baccata TaxID=106549 RepID=A0A540MZ83_MALBA|nr:hypothetical protein C1H46_010243 [Malus baccata]